MNKFTFLVLFVLLLLLTSAYSQEKSTAITGAIPLKLSIGAGVAIKNNIRLNNQYRNGHGDIIFRPIPLLQISYGPVFVGQQGLTVSALGDRMKSLYLNLNNSGDRYDGIGMESRKNSWFAGVGVKYNKFNLLISRDINGRSKGIKLNGSYAEFYTINKTFFTRSSLGLECFSKNYAEYYYGVRASEATISRAEYHPKAYCVPSMAFFPGYKVNENASVMTGVSLKTIAQQVRHSPTTNDNWLEAALILGGLWQF